MKEIKDFADDMKDELGDAEKYAKRALYYKDKDPEAAQLYFELSGEEIQHKNRIHDLALKYVQKASESGSPLVPGMKSRYEEEHDDLIEAEKGVRILREMYTE